MFARLVTLAQLVSLMLPINRVAPSYTADCGALRSVTVTALAQGAGPSLLVGTLEGQLYRRADARSCWVRIHAYPRGVEIGTLVASPGFPHTVIAGASFKVTTASGGSSFIAATTTAGRGATGRRVSRARRSCPSRSRCPRAGPSSSPIFAHRIRT